MAWYISNGMELEQGTGRIFLKYIYYHVVIQTVYSLFGAFIMAKCFGILNMFSSGIWPVFFVFLTLRCLKEPEGFTT